MPDWTMQMRSAPPDDGSAIQYYRWAVASTKVEVFTANKGKSSESETTAVRNYSAFLNGYAPEYEGLYDDY